jgi:hypothetical protein
MPRRHQREQRRNREPLRDQMPLGDVFDRRFKGRAVGLSVNR